MGQEAASFGARHGQACSTSVPVSCVSDLEQNGRQNGYKKQNDRPEVDHKHKDVGER
jgi:hypothetical protein